VKSPVRLERRLEQPRRLSWIIPLVSLLGALVVGAIVLLATGKNPLDVYWRMLDRGFFSQRALTGTLRTATPLAFTGLCAAAAFRLGVINIGGEGQLYVGAVGASLVGLWMGGSVPVGVTIIVMILAGMLFGAMYAAFVGVLRAQFNTSEIITSLMMNYLAGILLNYLIFNSSSYWRDPRSFGFPSGKPLDKRAHWPAFDIGGLSIPIGLFIAIAAAVVLWVVYKRSRLGFEISVIADSPRAARYVGIRTKMTIISVTALSGALAGAGGASQVGDFAHYLDAKGLQLNNFGYTGIVVAALARLSPLGAVLVAVLLGGLTNAGYSLQGPDFPSGLVGTLQGLILFCAVAGEILTKYKLRSNRKGQAVTA
jgi:simple sugar transport system permease protein